MKRHIGVDFGTSTTLVAVREEGSLPRILPIGKSTPWMPSLIGVDDTGRFVFGEETAGLPRSQVAESIKTLLGSGERDIELAGEIYKVEELIRKLLQEALRRARRAEPRLFSDQFTVFASCPALWTYAPRRLLADIYWDLDLYVDVADLIDEPVAAGLIWKNEQWLKNGSVPVGKTLIYDAGGGTLDIALVEVRDSEGVDYTVLSAEARQGSGDELDDRIQESLLKQLPDHAADLGLKAVLRARAREIKEMLSTVDQDLHAVGWRVPQTVQLNRTALETIFHPILAQSLNVACVAVRSAELRTTHSADPSMIRSTTWESFAEKIKNVVLVGGMSQIPLVRDEIQKLLPHSHVRLVAEPQLSVALGLTYGSEIARLNLPRPPVRFVAEWNDERGIESSTQVIYEAFQPLYQMSQVLRGETHLGIARDLLPPNQNSSGRFTVYAEAPDRKGTRYTLRIRSREAEIRTQRSIELEYRSGQPPRFKLYANGDLVLADRNRILELRLDGWPKARGPYVIEAHTRSHISPNEFRQGEKWRDH